MAIHREDEQQEERRVLCHGAEDIRGDGARHHQTDENLTELQRLKRHAKLSLADGQRQHDGGNHRSD